MPTSRPPEKIHILHYSIDSPLIETFLSAPGKKFMVYYNITQAEYFVPFSPLHAELCRQGRARLPEIVSAIEKSFAISEYSAEELRGCGFGDVQPLPLAADEQLLAVPPDPQVLQAFPSGETVFLYVGRVTPNKKQEDLVRLFAYYHQRIDPNSKLVLVGVYQGLGSYYDCLQTLVKDLNLQSAVIFTGLVSREALVAYYQVADVFVSMSEHEGFGLPLLEAMAFDVPVVAYSCTAVPEAMGGAGVLFREKNYPVLAEFIHLLVEDAALRGKIIQGQQRRWLENTKVEVGHNLIATIL